MMQKNILIYEDDLEILQLCRTILEPSGHHIEALSRCEHILSDIQRFRPDVILMDLWIPDIGGEQAITLMREHMPELEVPVILFSANDDVDAISKRIGAEAYLRKPFDIFALKKIVAEAIGV